MFQINIVCHPSLYVLIILHYRLYLALLNNVKYRLKIVFFAFTVLANASTDSSSKSKNDTSKEKNVFYYRRKSPLTTANLTEEEVPIQRYRTYRRRRDDGFKLNSSNLVSRLPELFKLATRTIYTTLNGNTYTTTRVDNFLINLSTTKKMTLLHSTTLSENIRLKTMTQFFGKKYINKNILVSDTEFNGTRHYYGKNKDELRSTDQKRKQQHFLKSLVQIYQKLMLNSSSSTHL